ncbi:YicC/YloC family endoribonuclease [Brevundimonas sp.]|uniref:YicC/YloC family endoribonuclease n=1 Tax=Brevundimonas sp. TaxID=1871086 RepID=UPI0025EA933D|nr:YicC/YloC family endoribonuclease [Brevundimonas sp.]
MTGFGRADGQSGEWAWSIEARSVNGRNLEVRTKSPPGFDALDRAARELAQARFQRGQVGVTIQLKRAEGAAAQVRVNTEMLTAYLARTRWLMEQGSAPPTADGLLALRGVLETADEIGADAQAALEAGMTTDLGAALDALKAAREDEGARLAPLLGGFLDRIAELTRAARGEAEAQTIAIRERFARRVGELTDGADGLEERVFQEAAMLAARADVREELDRLDAHTASARDLIAQAGAVGRRLDFLTQEFMREANTLCSKAATIALTGLGLDLKAVIEQFREQVQNVE